MGRLLHFLRYGTTLVRASRALVELRNYGQPLLSPYFILIFLFHVIQCRVQIKLLLLLLRHNRQHHVTPLTLLGVLKNEQYPPFKILKIQFINANNKMKVEMCREML